MVAACVQGTAMTEPDWNAKAKEMQEQVEILQTREFQKTDDTIEVVCN